MDEPIAKRMAERVFRLAKIEKTAALEDLVERLLQNSQEGHLCLELGTVPELPAALCSLGEEGIPFPKTPLVLQKNRLYLQRNWALESFIVRKAVELSSRTPSDPTLLAPQEHLEPEQAEAIAKAAQQSLSIFVGGPGTGKTYTAGSFIRLLAKSHPARTFKTMIAAPTGKAAAHLESALLAQGALPGNLRCESMTLHRLLRVQPGKQNFFSERTIDADLIVVDEASMLDVSLTLHLLNAIGSHTRLLLLGDPDQLPPVEAGSLFAELAQLFGHRLGRSLRVKEAALSLLVRAIQEGDVKPVLEAVSEGALFERREELISRLCTCLPFPIHSTQPDPAACLQEQKRLRILCALRQGPLGVDALNREIAKRFERQSERSEWLAIPILITQNDPKRHLYNGMMGVLIRRGSSGRAVAYFSDAEGVREVSEGILPRYEVAFCLSIHKSQGSEFEEVLVLFPPGSERFGKEALYTAVTRAKRKATLFANSSTIEEALKALPQKRSGFTERFLTIRHGRQDET